MVDDLFECLEWSERRVNDFDKVDSSDEMAESIADDPVKTSYRICRQQLCHAYSSVPRAGTVHVSWDQHSYVYVHKYGSNPRRHLDG